MDKDKEREAARERKSGQATRACKGLQRLQDGLDSCYDRIGSSRPFMMDADEIVLVESYAADVHKIARFLATLDKTKTPIASEA